MGKISSAFLGEAEAEGSSDITAMALLHAIVLRRIAGEPAYLQQREIHGICSRSTHKIASAGT
ncbi:MAG: hypothetical protein JXA18_05500 [Chitinispirillaceae bacterium]|nr:hypothetical protein [Chitinispirillaceae bacterium]